MTKTKCSCDECGVEFKRGDKIAYVDDGRTWHAACFESSLTPLAECLPLKPLANRPRKCHADGCKFGPK